MPHQQSKHSSRRGTSRHAGSSTGTCKADSARGATKYLASASKQKGPLVKVALT